MKKIFGFLFGIIEIVIIIYVMVVTTFMLMTNSYGYTELFDQVYVAVNKTNQDAFPDFKKGDLVIINTESYGSLTEGNEYYYFTSNGENYFINKGVLLTKEGSQTGSNYKFDSYDLVIPYSRVIGSYSGTSYHNMGTVLSILLSTVGFLLLVILPVFLLFIYHIYKLVIIIKYED